MNEILLYGDVGNYGAINPHSVIRQLQSLKGQPVNLRIMSDGGDVFGGLAIYNYVRGMPNVSATVDGLAASIASIIMLGAGRVTMPANGFIMVHNPAGVVMGESTDMRDLADLLDRTGTQLAGIYARETLNDEATARTWMANETWFDADQALAAGLIDEITEPSVIQARIDLGRFTRAPAALTAQIKQSPHQPKNNQMKKLIQALTELRLIDATEGENEDAIAAQVRTTVGALTAQRDALTVRITNELQGRATIAIDAAVADGRIAKAVQPQFVEAYVRDEVGTLAILASLSKPTASGTAPVAFGGPTDRAATTINDRIAAETDPRKRIRMVQHHFETVRRQ